MNREDIFWAAGLFDGEGCFSAAGRYPMATIGSTERILLVRFNSIVRVGNINGPYTRHTAAFRRRPQWNYQLYGFEKVQALLCLMWPWLSSEKRTKARRVLEAFRRIEANSVPERDPETPSPSRREDLAWAAGFFDGEGCFSRSRSALDGRITHTDREMVERFHAIVGIGKVYGPYRYGGGFGSTRDRWVYTVNGFENVQGLLAMLWFRLGRAKRDKAVQILSHHRTFYACGHRRQTVRWKKHCPDCFKPGPKRGSRRRAQAAP